MDIKCSSFKQNPCIEGETTRLKLSFNKPRLVGISQKKHDKVHNNSFAPWGFFNVSLLKVLKTSLI
jgi:hypothetical protein